MSDLRATRQVLLSAIAEVSELVASLKENNENHAAVAADLKRLMGRLAQIERQLHD